LLSSQREKPGRILPAGLIPFSVFFHHFPLDAPHRFVSSSSILQASFLSINPRRSLGSRRSIVLADFGFDHLGQFLLVPKRIFLSSASSFQTCSQARIRLVAT
jgi:hypothetical protein